VLAVCCLLSPRLLVVISYGRNSIDIYLSNKIINQTDIINNVSTQTDIINNVSMQIDIIYNNVSTQTDNIKH
jgi:hypothetical protein